jgi:hypothetical protein
LEQLFLSVSKLLELHVPALLFFVGLFKFGFQELFEASSLWLPTCESKPVQLEQLALLLYKCI